MEQQFMATQDVKRSHITNDSELPRKDTDPAGEERELHQRMFVPAVHHSTGPTGDLPLKVQQVLYTELDMEQEPMATQNANMSNITSDIEHFLGGNESTGEASDADGWVIVPQMGHSTGPSEETLKISFPGVFSRSNPNPNRLNNSSLVKVHMLVAGETFQTHETFMQKLKLRIELCSAESSNIILVFCPVVSHIRTDMEAAMARVTGNKPVILVFMHHCHNPSHMTNVTVQPSRSNIVQVVHCAFHETKGLLECQENEQAVKAVRSALLRCVDVQAEVPHTQSEIDQQPVAAQNANRSVITNEVPGTGTKERESDQRMIVPAKGHSTGPTGDKVELEEQDPMNVVGTSLVSKIGRFPFSKPKWNISSVKVHMLVAGETFKTHETFMQKLKLQIELCSAESSNVILVFCPVVSQIGTDMEAAMARVTEDKPVILVFMHHCCNPRHMTNITVQPSRSNIVQVVHCAFHEAYGLLRCQENDQAVAEVQEKLKKYK